MTQHPSEILLTEIEGFIAETGMGETYFGKVSVGNSELVPRLRERRKNGMYRSVLFETAESVRAFMQAYRQRRGDAA